MVTTSEPGPMAVIASGGGRYADPWHAFAATSAALADVLRADGWHVRVVDDPEAALAQLDGADLLVMNAGEGAGQGDPSADAAAGLAAGLDRGVGVLSVHSSLMTLADVPRWRAAIGGAWTDGSWHPEISPADVLVVDHDHPTTEGVDDFTLFDERYTGLAVDAGVRVLAVHEHAGVRHPLIWVPESGASRVVVSALGHDARAYECDPYRDLLARAARWAARR